MSERPTAALRVDELGSPSLPSVVTLLRLWGPATVATLFLTFAALLFVAPDAPRAAVVASLVVLALAAIVSSYVRRSLADLVGQAEREMVVQRRADLQIRQLHAERVAPSRAGDSHLLREIDVAVKGVITNLSLVAEQARAGARASDDEKDLAAVEQAVAKAVAECNQMTAGFAAKLPSEHRHAFNNAVMPLSYALDKATKRLTRLLHQQSPCTGGMDRARSLLEGARASAERIGVLTRRIGSAPEVSTPIV
jgi:hypothetical protein